MYEMFSHEFQSPSLVSQIVFEALLVCALHDACVFLVLLDVVVPIE
jgi:hypothetical protein